MAKPKCWRCTEMATISRNFLVSLLHNACEGEWDLGKINLTMAKGVSDALEVVGCIAPEDADVIRRAFSQLERAFEAKDLNKIKDVAMLSGSTVDEAIRRGMKKTLCEV